MLLFRSTIVCKRLIFESAQSTFRMCVVLVQLHALTSSLSSCPDTPPTMYLSHARGRCSSASTTVTKLALPCPTSTKTSKILDSRQCGRFWEHSHTTRYAHLPSVPIESQHPSGNRRPKRSEPAVNYRHWRLHPSMGSGMHKIRDSVFPTCQPRGRTSAGASNGGGAEQEEAAA